MDCNYSETDNCTPDMRNANGGYYSATRDGYMISPGAEWIRDDGTTYNQDNAYKATDFCNYLDSADRNVTLKVNWVYGKPAKPALTNPSGGNWTKTDFSLTGVTTTPADYIGYWYYSYNNKDFTRYDDSNANSYGKSTFTTSAFSAERNATAYIRVCNKNASGPTDTVNCSDSSETPIKIDKSPPYIYYSGFSNCSTSGGFSHCFSPAAKDDGSGVYQVWLTTSSGFDKHSMAGGPYPIWRDALNTNAGSVCFHYDWLCDALNNCTTSALPSPDYCWYF